MSRSSSAVYLFALTGDDAYEQVVEERLTETRPWFEDVFTLYRPEQGDALAFYASLPTANSQLAARIHGRWDELVATSPSYGLDPDADLYRAPMSDDRLHWGSSRVTASVGAANLIAVDRSDEPDALRARGLGHLNALHGVNPLGVVYLSNMGSLGAENSVTELLHYWFGDGSEYDGLSDGKVGPPPGYLVGGPNVWYSGSTSPPAGQPALKSYLDWNGVSVEESSWEISEPAIYYQSAYVRLLGAVLADGA